MTVDVDVAPPVDINSPAIVFTFTAPETAAVILAPQACAVPLTVPVISVVAIAVATTSTAQIVAPSRPVIVLHLRRRVITKTADAVLSGSGVLSAAAYEQYARDATLTGAGQLSAVVFASYRRSVEFAAMGVLSAVAELGAAIYYRAATLTGTGMLSATAVKTIDSAAAALSGSGVLSATAKPGFVRTATLSGAGILSATAAPRYTLAVALTGSGTLSATAGKSKDSIAAVLSGAGALTAIAAPRFVRAAALSTTGTLTVTAFIAGTRAADFTAAGQLSATVGVIKDSVGAALSGAGTLWATAYERYARTAALSSAGVLSAAAYPSYTRGATLSGSGSLSASADKTKDSVAAAFSGTGALSATTRERYSRAAALSGAGVLTATAGKTKDSVAAALAGNGVLSATAAPRFIRAAALEATGTLTATAILGGQQFERAAALSGVGVLTATAAPRFTRAAALSGAGVLSATANPRFARAAALSGAGTLTATAKPRFARSAALSSVGTLTATAAPTPTITKIAPHPGEGGANAAACGLVTITGTNYAAGATVSFAGSAATSVTVVNATTITAIPPAHADGAVDVTVTSNGITSDNYSWNYGFSAKKIIKNGSTFAIPNGYADITGWVEVNDDSVLTNSGETGTGIGDEGDKDNQVLAQLETLSAGLLQSLSLLVGNYPVAGNAYLGVYDTSGPSGGPGTLLDTTASFPLVTNSWNTQPVLGGVFLPAGNYWLAFHVESAVPAFRANVETGLGRFYDRGSFSALPTTFDTSPTVTDVTYCIYATTAGPAQTPTAADTSRAIVIVKDKTGATFAASIPFTGSNASRVHTARIMRVADSAIIATGPDVTGVAGTMTVSARANVAAGEHYKLQCTCPSTSARGTVTASTPIFTIT